MLEMYTLTLVRSTRRQATKLGIVCSMPIIIIIEAMHLEAPNVIMSCVQYCVRYVCSTAEAPLLFVRTDIYIHAYMLPLRALCSLSVCTPSHNSAQTSEAI